MSSFATCSSNQCPLDHLRNSIHAIYSPVNMCKFVFLAKGQVYTYLLMGCVLWTKATGKKQSLQKRKFSVIRIISEKHQHFLNVSSFCWLSLFICMLLAFSLLSNAYVAYKHIPSHHSTQPTYAVFIYFDI